MWYKKLFNFGIVLSVAILKKMVCVWEIKISYLLMTSRERLSSAIHSYISRNIIWSLMYYEKEKCSLNLVCLLLVCLLFLVLLTLVWLLLVNNWFNVFQHSCMPVFNASHPRAPKAATTEDNVTKDHHLVFTDCWLKKRESVETVGTANDRVGPILHKISW